MQILLNGKPREVPEGATPDDLVRELSLRDELVAVEVNEGLVPRRERAARRLAEGDRVEIVTLVGGG